MISTNILIIGQTGVGKSSLLNYLFGAELEQTGVGKPITTRGIFPHSYQVNEGFEAVIYDTWGLEADHAAEWETLLLDEVKKHDSMQISDWFHTVFFCVSAARARIEDFELSIAAKLRQNGSRVIAVITNAGNVGAERTVREMQHILQESGFEEGQIIPVSSVETESFAGVIRQFGRERLLQSVQDNLWKSICTKLPHNLKSTADWYLDESYQLLQKKANRYFNLITYNLRGRYDKFSSYCNKAIGKCVVQIEQDWYGLLDDAVVYYRELMAAYQIGVTLEVPDLKTSAYFHLHLSVTKQIKNFAKVNLIGRLVPGGLIIVPVMQLRQTRKEVKDYLDQCFTYLHQELAYKASKCAMFARN